MSTIIQSGRSTNAARVNYGPMNTEILKPRIKSRSSTKFGTSTNTIHMAIGSNVLSRCDTMSILIFNAPTSNAEKSSTTAQIELLAEVAVIKSLLDGAGIPYLTRGEDQYDAFRGAFRGTVFNPNGRPVAFLVPASMGGRSADTPERRRTAGGRRVASIEFRCSICRLSVKAYSTRHVTAYFVYPPIYGESILEPERFSNNTSS